MSNARFNVETFRLAHMAFQAYGFDQSQIGKGLRRTMESRLDLVDPPVAHRTLRIDPDTLFKRPQRFVVPKIVKKIQALVKPHLRFRRGGNLDVHVPNAAQLLRSW